MSRTIRVVTCNFELNGRGDRSKWLTMHERLAQLRPTILCRQENNGHTPVGAGRTLFNESKSILGLAGELGPQRGSTALYYDPEVFEEITVWDTERWFLHPTAMTLRVRGTKDIDVVAASAHLSYNSPEMRAMEVGDVTRLADRMETYPTADGPVSRKLPVLGIGIDTNSYVDPDRLITGEAPIPTLAEIKDAQHQAHRSYEIAPGQRVMDSRPDRTLLIAGLEDAARHAALLPNGPGLAAVAPTVDAWETHGPAHRVDRIFTASRFLNAVVHAEVVNMADLSDHHTLAVTYDLDGFIEIYRDAYALAA